MGKLTDDQLDQIPGTYVEFAGLIQVNYRYTKEKAKQKLDAFLQHQKHLSIEYLKKKSEVEYFAFLFIR